MAVITPRNLLDFFILVARMGEYFCFKNGIDSDLGNFGVHLEIDKSNTINTILDAARSWVINCARGLAL